MATACIGIYNYPIFNNHIEDGRLKTFGYVFLKEIHRRIKKQHQLHNYDFVNDAFYLCQYFNHKVIRRIIKIRLSIKLY